MPCFSGVLPVAIVFQILGDEMGICDRSVPCTPCWEIFARFGSLPASISGLTIRGEAPSIPIRNARPGGLGAEVSPHAIAQTRVIANPARQRAPRVKPRGIAEGDSRALKNSSLLVLRFPVLEGEGSSTIRRAWSFGGGHLPSELQVRVHGNKYPPILQRPLEVVLYRG